jgi:hypothetical protein
MKFASRLINYTRFGTACLKLSFIVKFGGTSIRKRMFGMSCKLC